MIHRAITVLDRCLAGLLRPAGWLVLPVSALLLLQWPLREWVRAWSTQANDLAQWLFALYIAAAVTQATRTGTHLAAEGLSRRHSPSIRRMIGHLGSLVCLLPWACFILFTAAPATWQSVVHSEAFPETSNPGYWVIKGAAWLLALAIAIQALLDLLRSR